MKPRDIEVSYFEWMYDIVCDYSRSGDISYRELLWKLNDIEFEYYIRGDYNRAADGIDLRRRFAYDFLEIDHAERYILGPCSVLEMMIALAIRCEEIMDDTEYGNRTAQWFWKMIVSLGLGGMTDERYNDRVVKEVINDFLDRNYDRDGHGGLFAVDNCHRDMREIEIWEQMICFINRYYVG